MVVDGRHQPDEEQGPAGSAAPTPTAAARLLDRRVAIFGTSLPLTGVVGGAVLGYLVFGPLTVFLVGVAAGGYHLFVTGGAGGHAPAQRAPRPQIKTIGAFDCCWLPRAPPAASLTVSPAPNAEATRFPTGPSS